MIAHDEDNTKKTTDADKTSESNSVAIVFCKQDIG